MPRSTQTGTIGAKYYGIVLTNSHEPHSVESLDDGEGCAFSLGFCSPGAVFVLVLKNPRHRAEYGYPCHGRIIAGEHL